MAWQINHRSGELSDNAEVVLRRRYLSKDRDGNVLEDADGLFRRVATTCRRPTGITAPATSSAGHRGALLPGHAPPGTAAQFTDADERRP